jgi:nucleoside-diphosphate-sugar epimerase
MRVLLTGTDGYIGVLMAPYLAARGHEVTGLDTGFYRDGWLYDADVPVMTKVRKDIRRVELDDLRGMDAVVHLAELSNDPLGQLNPEITYRINHEASTRLARLAREAGVARFVYTSSCSVYGVGTDEFKTERSEPNPQTAYAACKALVERDVSALATDGFTPTFLRNATAFGASPRMRFDIVLNNLSGLAWTTGRIAMTSDGTPWRPLVHVLDICEAVACVLDASPDAVRAEIFNVGDDAANYRVREIAQIVADTFPGCELSLGAAGGDNRSYRVSFAKIREHLPAFHCRHDAAAGARQLRGVFEEAGITRETFESRPYTRLKQLEHLIGSGQVDRELFWVAPQAG